MAMTNVNNIHTNSKSTYQRIPNMVTDRLIEIILQRYGNNWRSDTAFEMEVLPLSGTKRNNLFERIYLHHPLVNFLSKLKHRTIEKFANYYQFVAENG